MLKLFFPFSAIFNLLTSLAIGLFVITKGWKSKVNRGFFSFTFSIVIWSIGYFYWQVSEDEKSAIFWVRFLTVGSIWITPWFYYFAIKFLGLTERKYKATFILGLFMSLVLTFFDIFTNHMIASTRQVLIFPFWPVPGRLYIFSLGMFLFFSGYALLLLWHDYKIAGQFRKKQIRYVFLGYFIGFIGGCTNFPQWYGIDILPLGNILVSFYPFLVGYSIIKYHLFEIDTVIHRTFLWILTSAAVLLPIGALLYFLRHTLESLRLPQLTLVVTALFYLFLYYFKVMQPKIDHFFRRRKYDYYQLLAQIPQQIGSELDTKKIIERLFKELTNVLYVRNALLLIRQETQTPGEHNYLEIGSCGYDKISEEQAKQRKEAFLSSASPLKKWILDHQKALEREQVEVDPQFETIKKEALSFFRENFLEVAIPVTMEGKVSALLGIGKKESLSAYTLKDIELLEGIGRQLGITIDNALHHEDIVEKERLAEELRLGRDIQMNLLPKELPRISGFSIDGLMVPAKEIGGDYYDFITLPKEDKLAIAIGDVSGKGVAAGLLMAMAKTAIHTLSQEETSPKDVLVRTNSILFSHIGGQKFMTMLYFKYNPANRTLTYSSAGHEHILVYHDKTKEVESIISGGIMLGAFADIEAYLEEHDITLCSKDKLVLYTDGVTDAESTSGERFSLERLKQSFKENSGKAPFEMIHAIKQEVYRFIGSQPQYDDITLVGMEAA